LITNRKTDEESERKVENVVPTERRDIKNQKEKERKQI
jgi:hypothetical protein